jgi:hypothetical protein
MDKLLWAYASSTTWPLVVLLCSSFFLTHDGSSDGIEIGHGVQDEEFVFYVAMLTAAHG